MSSAFAWGLDPEWPVIAAAVAVMAAMGAVYLWLPRLIRRSPRAAIFVWAIVTVGLAMRLLFLGSSPILEDDHYRYLWDGAVAAEGYNPFRYAPLQAIANNELPLHNLADQAGQVLERVNHPQYRTVYPTLAQAGFALAYAIGPFDLDAWRLVVLVAELIGLAFILLTLRRLDLAPQWVALYWWNPLVVKELANSAHMDGLLVPLLAVAMWAVTCHRWITSSLMIVLAAAIKIWPILLLPTVLRPLAERPRHLLGAVLLLIVVAAVLALPILQAGLTPSSGLLAYGRGWQMNDAVFSVLLGMSEFVFDPSTAQTAARLVVVLILGALVLFLSRTPARDGRDPIRHFLIVAAALFLLSPTGFPWYMVWFVPFLAVVPVMPLLLLTALLPLYYLRFTFSAHDLAGVFDHYVVWLEFGPVWLWLGVLALRHRRSV